MSGISSTTGDLSVLTDDLIIHVLRLAEEGDRREMSQTCKRLAENALRAMPPLVRCIEGRTDVIPFVCDHKRFINLFGQLRWRIGVTEEEINARVCPYVKTLYYSSERLHCLDYLKYSLYSPQVPSSNNALEQSIWLQLQKVVLIGDFSILAVEALAEAKLKPPQLSALTLSVNSQTIQLHTKSINNFIVAYPQLRSVRIDQESHTLVADSTMTALTQCSHLERLGLPNAATISSNALIEVAQACTKLTCIDLSGCASVTDAVLEAIATHCPKLCSIDLSKCPNISLPAALYRFPESDA